MKVLIFCVILFAAAQGGKKPDCTRVKCAKPPKCPEDSVLIEGDIPPGQCCPKPGQCNCNPAKCLKKECKPHYKNVLKSKGSGKPGRCCDVYECKPDCNVVSCAKPSRPYCPEDSMLVKGNTPLDQCCTHRGRCECKPAKCVKKKCKPGYLSVLRSKGSGKPGDCCDKYDCKRDCRTVKCAKPLHPNCPEDSVLVERKTLPDQCCPEPSRCECKRAQCLKKKCAPGYISVLESKGSGKPGNCNDIYKCKQDCTRITCPTPKPLICPEDSVLMKNITRPDECCPQPNRCECKPAGCVKKDCGAGYSYDLKSKGSGNPGDCCDKYECKWDCTGVTCPTPNPPSCPEDSVLIKNITRPDECCPPPNRCECKPAGCVKKDCGAGYSYDLKSKGSGNPGDCCDKYECKQVCYTQWFDLDNPSGNGDYEIIDDWRKMYPGLICDKPLSIQATTLSGVPAESAGQVIQTYDTVTGFACVNSQQRNGESCLDYKMRIGCPCP